MAKLNLTSDYYTGNSPSLLWEMTICQSLGDGDGTFAKALTRPAAYGALAGEYLLENTSLTPDCGRIIEIGGGYGTLMAALLKVLQPGQIEMVDISPTLLQKQRERLKSLPISFHCSDLFRWLPQLQQESVDLLILNEIIGDFPTITGVSKAALAAALNLSQAAPDPYRVPAELAPEELLTEAGRLIAAYDLELNDLPPTFNLNYGALLFIERLAATGIKRTFITEHGCDTILPYPFSLFSAILPPSDRNPRQIKLKDHDEYNIRFDHLQQVAEKLNFRCRRFHLMDLLNLRFDDEINYLLSTRKPASEEQEIFLEFYEHVAEYQGIILEQ